MIIRPGHKYVLLGVTPGNAYQHTLIKFVVGSVRGTQVSGQRYQYNIEQQLWCNPCEATLSVVELEAMVTLSKERLKQIFDRIHEVLPTKVDKVVHKK